MPHPFFEADAYPWHREDALTLYRCLHQSVPDPGRIDILYRSAAQNLPPLALNVPPDLIWRQALDSLISARALRELCGLLLQDMGILAIHAAVQAVIDAPSVESPVMSLPDAVKTELFESLTRLRADTPNHTDRSFLAEHLVRRVNVRPPDAHLSMEETLRNVTGSGRTEVIRIVVSDAPVEFKHLKLKAQIQLPNEPEPFDASVKGEASPDRRLFRVTLGFRGRVVPPVGGLTIRWRCVVPGSVARNKDYWVFPFLFNAPAPKMTIEAGFLEEPAEVNLFSDQFEVSSGQERLTPIATGGSRVENDNGERFVVFRAALEQAAGRYLFAWTLSSD